MSRSVLEKLFEDEHISVWNDAHIVVIYYFGDVYDAHIETIRLTFNKLYSDFGKIAYLSIVGQNARPPTHQQRKDFLTILDDHQDNTVTANWLLTRGFRASFVRSIIGAMSILKPRQVMRVFQDGSEACHWLSGQTDEESAALHEAALHIVDDVGQRSKVRA